MRIAERWFELERLDGGLTRLWEPHLHPIWQSNIWHVRGRDRDLLVDSGIGLGSVRDALAGFLDQPVIAVATHRHADHIGGMHEFDARAAHAADAPFLAEPEPLTLLTADYPPGFVAFIERHGAPVGEALIDALPYEGYDLRSAAVVPCPATQLLESGDVVDLGDRAFEVLHLPGHTPGSIGLWDAKSGTLFSGDAIYDGPLFDFLPESDIADYVRTMRALRDLPVQIVHGGHDPSFGRARMLEIIDAYLTEKGDR